MASKRKGFCKCYRLPISAISSSVVRLEPSSLLILVIHLVLICMMPSLITITSHGTESWAGEESHFFCPLLTSLRLQFFRLDTFPSHCCRQRENSAESIVHHHNLTQFSALLFVKVMITRRWVKHSAKMMSGKCFKLSGHWSLEAPLLVLHPLQLLKLLRRPLSLLRSWRKVKKFRAPSFSGPLPFLPSCSAHSKNSSLLIQHSVEVSCWFYRLCPEITV